MSIIEITMYTAKCDNCGKEGVEGSDYAGWNDKDYAEEEATESDWEKGDDNDALYCPDCYYYDDNGDFKVKDEND